MRGILILCSIFLILLFPASGLNIGVSPTKVMEKNVLPGTQLEYDFQLQVLPMSMGVNVTCNSSGNASSWLNCDKWWIVNASQDIQKKDFHIVVHVPQETQIGLYSAHIVLTESLWEKKNSQDYSISIPVDIEILVTNKELSSVKITNIVAKPSQQEVLVSAKVENDGNIPIESIDMTARVVDMRSGIEIKTVQQKIHCVVEAFSSQNIYIPLEEPLPKGNYVIYLTFEYNKEFFSDSVAVTVLEKNLVRESSIKKTIVSERTIGTNFLWNYFKEVFSHA